MTKGRDHTPALGILLGQSDRRQIHSEGRLARAHKRAQARAAAKANAEREIPRIVARRDTKPGAREMFALRKAGWGQ